MPRPGSASASSMSVVLSVVTGLLVVVGAACSTDADAVKRQHVQRGDADYAAQKYNEAIIEYRVALQADPRFGEAHQKLADAYARIGDGEDAFKEVMRAADLLPDDLNLQLAAGDLLRRGGQFLDAKSRAEAVLKKDPKNVPAELLLGYALVGLKDRTAPSLRSSMPSPSTRAKAERSRRSVRSACRKATARWPRPPSARPSPSIRALRRP